MNTHSSPLFTPRALSDAATALQPIGTSPLQCRPVTVSIRATRLRTASSGAADGDESAIEQVPHTADMVTANEWNRAYDRETAAYPTDWVRENKFWPSVRRVNDAYGDRNLFCSCPPSDAYEADEEDELEAVLEA